MTDPTYFIFETYDSWAEKNITEEGYGYSVFKKTDDKLEIIMGPGEQGPPNLEDTVEFLRKKNISKLFTRWFPLEGFCGIKGENPDQHGNTIDYSVVEEQAVKIFEGYGIEVVFTNP